MKRGDHPSVRPHLPRIAGEGGLLPAARILLAGMVWLLVLFSSCKPSFDPVDLKPEDICAKCRNPIRDSRFAGEIVFVGGETMKFDDLGCLVAFHFGVDSATAHGVFVQDFNRGGWVGEEEAYVLLHSSVVSPRYSNSIAFKTEAAAQKARAADGGTVLPLTAVLKKESIWMEPPAK
jgi:copper chaperone NosL